jgi:hypothetical protein
MKPNRANRTTGHPKYLEERPMKKNIEKYRESARKGIEFLLANFNADGSFIGTEHMIAGAYKSPLAFLTAGQSKEAEIALNYIVDRFMADGDFHNGFCDISLPMTNNYRNAWLIWGSHALDRPDICEPAAEYLESCINPELGGVPGRLEYCLHESVLDWGCSALATVAFSHMGRLDAARECARFLIEMLDSQPEPEWKLYLRKTWDNKLYHIFPRHQATEYMVEFQAPDQVVWYFGAAMAGLGYLYNATKESRWLDTAERIFNLTKKCRPEVYTTLTSAKIGWGSSVLFTITGEQEYADTMVTVADHVVATQEEKGGWVRYPLFRDWEHQPPVLGVDVSLERTLWLNFIAKSLEGG